MSNLAKVIFAGVVGAGVGSLVTYFCVRNHYANKADEEIESIRNLYCKPVPVNTEEQPEEDEKIISNNQDDMGSAIYDKFKFGEVYTDYTAYSKSESNLAESEHPSDDEGEDKIYVISSIEYDEDHLYEKRSIYYYIDNDLFLDEENESECIGEDGKTLGDYKLLVSAALDIDKFKNANNDTIFVRNDNVQIDFEIIRMRHYVL